MRKVTWSRQSRCIDEQYSGDRQTPIAVPNITMLVCQANLGACLCKQGDLEGQKKIMRSVLASQEKFMVRMTWPR